MFADIFLYGYILPMVIVMLKAYIGRKGIAKEELKSALIYSTIPILNILFIIGILYFMIRIYLYERKKK